jgi:hypothetical protein
MIKTGNKKIWLLVAITLVIVVQLTVLSEFRSISVEGYATNVSVVDITKQNYVYARLIVSVTPSVNKTIVTFPNGTQAIVSPFQTESFTIVMPRTGDIFGNDAAAVNGLSVSESQPVGVAVMSNYTSSSGTVDVTPLTNIPNFDVYLLIIIGYADVNIQGYGIAI